MKHFFAILTLLLLALSAWAHDPAVPDCVVVNYDGFASKGFPTTLVPPSYQFTWAGVRNDPSGGTQAGNQNIWTGDSMRVTVERSAYPASGDKGRSLRRALFVSDSAGVEGVQDSLSSYNAKLDSIQLVMRITDVSYIDDSTLVFYQIDSLQLYGETYDYADYMVYHYPDYLYNDPGDPSGAVEIGRITLDSTTMATGDTATATLSITGAAAIAEFTARAASNEYWYVQAVTGHDADNVDVSDAVGVYTTATIMSEESGEGAYFLVYYTPPPTTPTDFAIDSTICESAVLTWTDGDFAEYVVIRRSTNGSTFTTIDTVLDGVGTYTDDGLALSRYWYRIYAHNSTGNSNISSTYSLLPFSCSIVEPLTAPDPNEVLWIVNATSTRDGNGDGHVDWQRALDSLLVFYPTLDSSRLCSLHFNESTAFLIPPWKLDDRLDTGVVSVYWCDSLNRLGSHPEDDPIVPTIWQHMTDDSLWDTVKYGCLIGMPVKTMDNPDSSARFKEYDATSSIAQSTTSLLTKMVHQDSSLLTQMLLDTVGSSAHAGLDAGWRIMWQDSIRALDNWCFEPRQWRLMRGSGEEEISTLTYPLDMIFTEITGPDDDVMIDALRRSIQPAYRGTLPSNAAAVADCGSKSNPASMQWIKSALYRGYTRALFGSNVLADSSDYRYSTVNDHIFFGYPGQPTLAADQRLLFYYGAGYHQLPSGDLPVNLHDGVLYAQLDSSMTKMDGAIAMTAESWSCNDPVDTTNKVDNQDLSVNALRYGFTYADGCVYEPGEAVPSPVYVSKAMAMENCTFAVWWILAGCNNSRALMHRVGLGNPIGVWRGEALADDDSQTRRLPFNRSGYGRASFGRGEWGR